MSLICAVVHCDSSIAVADFTFSSDALTIPPTGQMQCSNVTILDDAILEGTETLTLQLSTSSPRVEIANSTATVIIQDDDSKLRSKLGRHLHVFVSLHSAL